MGFFDFLKSKRGEEVAAFGRQSGFNYSAKDEFGAIKLLGDFQLFRIGGGRKIKHLLSKNFLEPDQKVRIFDYQYTISTGNSAHTYVQTVFFINSKELGLPKFYLKPEKFVHRLKAWFGINDIDFPGFPHFSKSYYLNGEDEYLIRQTFTGEVFDFFRHHTGWSVEGLNYFMIFYKAGKKQPPGALGTFAEMGFQLFELFKNKGYRV